LGSFEQKHGNMGMSKSVVALVRCNSYDEAKVSRAVGEGVGLLGGVTCFVKPGERIVLKPNVLIGSDPDKAVTTHPSLLAAVGRLLQDAGVDAYYGDSSAVGSSERNLRRAKLKEAADCLELKLADFDNGKAVVHKEAVLNKHFVIANGVLESDGLVSLSKLKTHGLVRFTGAIKNQFGCIPGILKSEYHVRMPDPYDFSAMLVDLNTLIRPRLYIMDAVVAMEGNGPRGGRPKKLGLMLFSTDPVALDSIACRIIALDPEFVPTLAAGEKAGLGTYHYENIETVGESIEPFIDRDFEADRTRPLSDKGGFLKRLLRNRISRRPVINRGKCSKCGMCVSICPVDPKAVDWTKSDKSRPPTHRYGQCIRCFCCQETCPEGAIAVREPLMGKIYRRLNRINARI
jgi:uncharacterized protein (DUF362 family)/NAD-dependent dihydropyrimidine dehydrogenase PreA subunit